VQTTDLRARVARIALATARTRRIMTCRQPLATAAADLRRQEQPQIAIEEEANRAYCPIAGSVSTLGGKGPRSREPEEEGTRRCASRATSWCGPRESAHARIADDRWSLTNPRPGTPAAEILARPRLAHFSNGAGTRTGVRQVFHRRGRTIPSIFSHDLGRIPVPAAALEVRSKNGRQLVLPLAQRWSWFCGKLTCQLFAAGLRRALSPALENGDRGGRARRTPRGDRMHLEWSRARAQGIDRRQWCLECALARNGRKPTTRPCPPWSMRTRHLGVVPASENMGLRCASCIS